MASPELSVIDLLPGKEGSISATARLSAHGQKNHVHTIQWEHRMKVAERVIDGDAPTSVKLSVFINNQRPAKQTKKDQAPQAEQANALIAVVDARTRKDLSKLKRKLRGRK